MKHSVKILEQTMLRCIIAAIAEVQTSYKSTYLSVVPRCLSIHKYTLLMMSKESTNDLRYMRE